MILLGSLVWAAGHVASIKELAQFGLIIMLQGMVIASCGWRFYCQAPVALLYWFLLVPSGEPLLPLLQSFTSRMAVFWLDLVQIPVLRDGYWLEVPTGQYQVAPGCSGLNFLLAAIAIALPFGELNYRDPARKLAFLAAMLAVALLGNGLRVSSIIALADWTGNIGNIADDHLIYGWLLFALLTFAALALGQKFQQDLSPASHPPAVGPITPWPRRLMPLSLALLPVGLMLALPVPMPSRNPPKPQCGALAPSRAESLQVNDDHRAAIACKSAAGTLQIMMTLMDLPIRQSKLANWQNPWRADEGARLIGRLDVEIAVEGQKLPARLESWRNNDLPVSSWILIWSDGAWRRPGFDAALADLRSDLRGQRHSVVLQLSIAADRARAEPEIRRYLADAPLRAMIGD